MAETGWDFSSRWLTNSSALGSARTSDILPVDLNAFLYLSETTMARLHDAAGSPPAVAQRYRLAASKRQEAMDAVMWDEGTGCWRDALINGSMLHQMHAGVFTPLFAGAYDPSNTTRLQMVVDAVTASGLVMVGGVSTTLINSGQQWDLPNAWPPLQHMLIVGLNGTGLPGAQSLALQLTKTWLNTGLAAYNRSGFM